MLAVHYLISFAASVGCFIMTFVGKCPQCDNVCVIFVILSICYKKWTPNCPSL